MPSVRLVALVMATTTNMQKGINQTPQSTKPKKGIYNWDPPAMYTEMA